MASVLSTPRCIHLTCIKTRSAQVVQHDLADPVVTVVGTKRRCPQSCVVGGFHLLTCPILEGEIFGSFFLEKFEHSGSESECYQLAPAIMARAALDAAVSAGVSSGSSGQR